MSLLFDVDSVKYEWLQHFKGSRFEKDIVDSIERFFYAPQLYVLHGSNGFFLGTLAEQQRRVFLACTEKVDEIKTHLESQLQVQLPTCTGGFISNALTDLQQIAVSTNNEYYKHKKSVDKYYKDLKRQRKLQGLQQQRRNLMNALPQRDLIVFLSLDVEWHEDNHDAILELGWSLWNNHTQQYWSKHWIVQETIYILNGKYVPNHKHGFIFGNSVTGSLAEGVQQLQQDILHGGLEGDTSSQDAASYLPPVIPPLSDCRIILVGHGIHMDLSMLQNLGVTLPRNMEIADTQQIAWARSDGAGSPTPGLENLLKSLRIRPMKLHNAGNDARFTLEALIGLLR